MCLRLPFLLVGLPAGAAMYDSALIIFAVHVLHLSPAKTGLAVALGSVGFPVSSALSGKLNRRLGLGPSLIAADVPSVAGLIVASLAAGPAAWWVLALGTLLVGLGQGCFAVNAVTLRQFAAAPGRSPPASWARNSASGWRWSPPG